MLDDFQLGELFSEHWAEDQGFAKSAAKLHKLHASNYLRSTPGWELMLLESIFNWRRSATNDGGLDGNCNERPNLPSLASLQLISFSRGQL